MPCGFREEDLCFSNCKSMGAYDPSGGTNFDPRDMVGRIYKEDHIQNMKPLGLVVSEKMIFYVFPMMPPGLDLYGPQGYGWQDL